MVYQGFLLNCNFQLSWGPAFNPSAPKAFLGFSIFSVVYKGYFYMFGHLSLHFPGHKESQGFSWKLGAAPFLPVFLPPVLPWSGAPHCPLPKSSVHSARDPGCRLWKTAKCLGKIFAKLIPCLTDSYWFPILIQASEGGNKRMTSAVAVLFCLQHLVLSLPASALLMRAFNISSCN